MAPTRVFSASRWTAGNLIFPTRIEITPDRAGTFDITCGMSMLHGSLVVED